MAELLCRANQLQAPEAIRRAAEAGLDEGPPQEVSEIPHQLGATGRNMCSDVAQSTHPSPMTRRALGRSNRRQEPDALTRSSGSVRGAPGNRCPYRDWLRGRLRHRYEAKATGNSYSLPLRQARLSPTLLFPSDVVRSTRDLEFITCAQNSFSHRRAFG